MYWEREYKSSLKLGDFSQKPNVSFWQSFIISLEVFWGKISNFAKNLEKLTDARHFSKKWSSLSVYISFYNSGEIYLLTSSLTLMTIFPFSCSLSFFSHFSYIPSFLSYTSILSSLLCLRTISICSISNFIFSFSFSESSTWELPYSWDSVGSSSLIILAGSGADSYLRLRDYSRAAFY